MNLRERDYKNLARNVAAGHAGAGAAVAAVETERTMNYLVGSTAAAGAADQKARNLDVDKINAADIDQAERG